MLKLFWNGLALGSFYGLVGIGLAITFGLWGFLNFAQGDFMVLGAYFVYILATFLHTNLLLAIIVGTVALGIVLAIIARGTFHYTHGNLINGYILATGIGLVVQNSLELGMSSAAREISVKGLGQIHFLDASIPVVRLTFFIVSVLTVIGISWFLGNTAMGRYIRAAAQNHDAAKIVGVNVDRIEFVSYVISGGLAAIAGIGLLIQFVITPYLGARYVLKACAALLLGGAYKGFGHIGATFIAGLALGLVESIGGYYVSMQWQDIFSYALLYVGLISSTKLAKR